MKANEGHHDRKTDRFHRVKANQNRSRLATAQPFFDALLSEYNQKKWIYSDPAQFMHRYTDAKDQELAAYFAASFAYGTAKLIIRAVEKVLTPMGSSPHQFILEFKSSMAQQKDGLWNDFYHRFHKKEHLVALVEILSGILKEHRTLGDYFKHFNATDSEVLLNQSMRDFQERALAWTNKNIPIQRQKAFYRGLRFLFNAPEDGSACKRMSMFLKWMVRKDQIDLGIWNWFNAANLVIPADTHIARLSYYLRLRNGRVDGAPNWKMAVEITSALKQLNPDDPVCYDFAITRLGILGLCKKKYFKSICEKCPVEPACRFSQKESP